MTRRPRSPVKVVLFPFVTTTARHGTVAVRDVNRFLAAELLDEEEATTIGGLCVTLAEGRIPAAGETFELATGASLEVVESSARRVRSVRVRVRHPASEDEAAATCRP